MARLIYEWLVQFETLVITAVDTGSIVAELYFRFDFYSRLFFLVDLLKHIVYADCFASKMLQSLRRVRFVRGLRLGKQVCTTPNPCLDFSKTTLLLLPPELLSNLIFFHRVLSFIDEVAMLVDHEISLGSYKLYFSKLAPVNRGTFVLGFAYHEAALAQSLFCAFK